MVNQRKDINVMNLSGRPSDYSYSPLANDAAKISLVCVIILFFQRVGKVRPFAWKELLDHMTLMLGAESRMQEDYFLKVLAAEVQAMNRPHTYEVTDRFFDLVIEKK